MKEFFPARIFFIPARILVFPARILGFFHSKFLFPARIFFFSSQNFVGFFPAPSGQRMKGFVSLDGFLVPKEPHNFFFLLFYWEISPFFCLAKILRSQRILKNLGITEGCKCSEFQGFGSLHSQILEGIINPKSLLPSFPNSGKGIINPRFLLLLFPNSGGNLINPKSPLPKNLGIRESCKSSEFQGFDSLHSQILEKEELGIFFFFSQENEKSLHST